MTSPAALTFGDTPLLSPNPPWADYAIEATAEGTTWGNPDAVVATVASMLMDGEKAKITRFGNREATVPLQIRGATLDAVAAGEAELMAEINKGRNTLAWSPPGWSTPSVFDVVYSTLDFKYDDLAEKDRVTRFFTLTLVCLPFARRADPTVTIATPVPAGAPTITPINDCTSLAGWSSGSVVGGAIVTPAPTSGFFAGDAVNALNQTYTLAAGEFIVWEIKSAAGATMSFGANGLPTVVRATQALAGGVIRYYVQPIGVTYPYIVTTTYADAFAYGGSLTVYDLSKYNKLPLIGAGFQRMFNAAIGGTARTAADILIECSSGAFVDEALVYTSKSAALPPPMRGWKTAGDSATLDAVMVSGGRNTFTTPTVFTIPANLVAPGTHSMVARLSGAGAATTMSWTVKTLTTHATASTTVAGSIGVTMAPSGYADFALGVLELPTIEVDPSTTGNVEITLASSVSAISLDELWLFNLDDGVLTWISGLTTSPTRLLVRSATVDREHPGWLVGTAGTDAANVSVADRCVSPGVHVFEPGDLTIFVATLGSAAVTTTITSYDRFLHHVPAVAP